MVGIESLRDSAIEKIRCDREPLNARADLDVVRGADLGAADRSRDLEDGNEGNSATKCGRLVVNEWLLHRGVEVAKCDADDGFNLDLTNRPGRDIGPNENVL